jgi:hypothetical protein
MIKEIADIDSFDKAVEEWNNDTNLSFWQELGVEQKHNFNADSIETRFRLMFLQSLTNPKQEEKIKLWSYEEDGKSIAGCAFSENYNFLMGENVLQEMLWQFNGKFAKTYKEVKILNLLLKHAEEYARSKKLDSIIIGRDPRLHKPFMNNKIEIKNYYTNQDYTAFSVFYIKSLKNKS